MSGKTQTNFWANSIEGTPTKISKKITDYLEGKGEKLFEPAFPNGQRDKTAKLEMGSTSLIIRGIWTEATVVTARHSKNG